MNTFISVSSDALDAGAVESLASLPATYRVGDSGGPRVAVARGADWMREALARIGQGSDGVLAVPSAFGAADPATAAALDESRRPVVIDDRWSHNPGVAPLAAALERVTEAELLELGTHIGEGDVVVGALIDLLVLGDVLTGPLESISVASVRPHAITATATAKGSRTLVAAVHRSAVGSGHARVRAVGPSQAVDAVLPEASTAAAAIVRLHGAEGAVHYPTVFESSHRAAWRALAEAVHADTAVSDVSRRNRVIGLLGPELASGPPTKTGTQTGPANQEEKK